MPAALRTGLDALLDDDARIDELRRSRVALLGNPTSVSRRFEHAIDALAARGVKLRRLFGPEHGVRGEAQDMVAVAGQRDPISGIETVSLYGHSYESLRPPPGTLDDIDILLVDLQDVGARYYTYIYTALFALRETTRLGVEAWVLDRPNPIGGAIEGPSVDPGFESFVGLLRLPNRHGLTFGEVMRFAAQHETLVFSLIPVEGYARSMWFDRTDAPWVMPSPNMPTVDTAAVYPGQCLLEGTNLSEGRGTTRPFEIFGAPWLDASAMRAELEQIGVPGARFRLLSFEPTFQKWARTRCSGLQIHVTDRDAFNSLRTSAAIVWAARRTAPEFAWRAEAYEFVRDIPAIDLLFGSARPRLLIDAGAAFSAVEAALQTPPELRQRVLAARLGEYDD